MEENRHIAGSQSVGRDLSVGGDAAVRGSAVVGHNLKVEGWLDARNIKGPCRGLFLTIDKLLGEYPRPEAGWWALVGTTLPAEVYVAEGRRWVGTGKLAGSFNFAIEEDDGQGWHIVDRGKWRPTERYYSRGVNPGLNSALLEVSDVWHAGCKWRCMRTGTPAEPRWNSADWAFIEGDPHFKAEFVEGPRIFDPTDFECPLTIRATLHNQDVTADILDADVQWSRKSYTPAGEERTVSDQIWEARLRSQGRGGKAVVLKWDDLDVTSEGMPRRITFSARVRLRDGIEDTATMTI